MFTRLMLVLLFYYQSHLTQAKRILVVIPTPSISHQVIFRPLTQELARRGHEVIVITPNPAFPKDKTPKNLKEIDVKDVSYETKSLNFAKTAKGNTNDIYEQVGNFFVMFRRIFEAQVTTKQVQELINDKSQQFDLLIIEACVRPAYIYSHIYKAPVILISSVGNFGLLTDIAGVATHPILYPTIFHQKLYNLTVTDKIKETFKHIELENVIANTESDDDKMLRNIFGNEIPTVKELKENVDMLFVNMHHILDDNRPVPPNFVYIGGIHTLRETNELPDDLKSYLDSSENGIIYMSFGSNIFPSMLPKPLIQAFLNVFSQLPFDVLFKWDTDTLPGCPENVKIFKWLPQLDLLRHPNVKLFITQGGLQSTEEAISAGVPLIGVPMLGDQWYNVEKYVKHNIGLRIDLETMTEEKLMNAIKTIVRDDRYRENIITFRNLLHDQPMNALERAVWWTEHVLRHGGARHLRAPAANMSWIEYYEFELISTILVIVTTSITSIIMLVCLFKNEGKVLKKIKRI